MSLQKLLRKEEVDGETTGQIPEKKFSERKYKKIH